MDWKYRVSPDLRARLIRLLIKEEIVNRKDNADPIFGSNAGQEAIDHEEEYEMILVGTEERTKRLMIG